MQRQKATPRAAQRLHILHIDMDAFYASVEQRDEPKLRGRPVVVGGPPGRRGVVATCSYEARRFGIHSAMPSREALRLCPQVIFVRPNFEKYKQASRKIHEIFHRFTDLVEPLSLDEAYLDVGQKDGIAVGRAIKLAIKKELNLTASVGVSYNKFLAKLASDLEKPDGFTIIDRQRAQDLLPTLPVRKLWGVGPKGEEQLRALNIQTCADLTNTDPAELRARLGRRADELLMLARGEDPRRVQPEREVKSVGEEMTFEWDRDDTPGLIASLNSFAEEIARRLQRQLLRARTVTIKVRFSDFETITRSQTLIAPTDQAAELAAAATALFERQNFNGRKLRLLGLTASNLVQPGESVQLKLKL